MVNVNIKQPTFFKGLEWFLFLGLCTLSAYFMREVVDKFISRDTSFKVYEEFIDEIPTMVLCSSDNSEISPPLSIQKNNSVRFNYGKDFTITYWQSILKNGKWVGDKIVLDEGENNIPNRFIYLETLTTAWSGFCFKINETTVKIENGEWRYLSLKFNKTVDQKNLPPWVVYFTSEKNAHGILRSWWFDGDIAVMYLKKFDRKQIILKPRKYKYLTNSNPSCGEASFYECWGSKSVNISFNTCPRKCLPYSVPNNEYDKIPLCDTVVEWDCAHKLYNMVMENITKSGICPKLCTVSHYSGEGLKHGRTDSEYFGYWYTIAHPFTATITEEYLIYDTLTVISSVGGTLGMCIGFSFTNIIAYLMTLIQNLISNFQDKKYFTTK